MRSPCCLCFPPSSSEYLTNLYETWCVQHGTWAHLNGVLHKYLQTLCVSICIPLTLLGNGSVNTFPRQRIHINNGMNCWTWHFICGPCLIKCEYIGLSLYPLQLLGKNPTKTFPRQRRIVGCVVFYAVHIVSKENRPLVLLRTSICEWYFCNMFRCYKVIIREIPLRNCCIVLIFSGALF
jgi:hypothetical protein